MYYVMTEQTILIKKKLKEEWANLKNDTKPPIIRRKAATNIIELQHQIQDIDEKFETIDLSNTIYAEFLPKSYINVTNVNWISEPDPLEGVGNAVSLVKSFEYEAVKMAKERLPKEAIDSQKFGMIVGHYTKCIEDAYIFQNS